MTRIRPFTPNDAEPLDKLWREHWSGRYVPDCRYIITDAVAENESGIVGYGQVRLIAEADLFIDPTARLRDRAVALKLLMNKAILDSRLNKVEELYAFIQDPNFSKLIQSRYGFTPVPKPGELLLRKV